MASAVHRFLDCDFVEGVHGHFDIAEIDAGLIRFDADLDVVVDHPLHGHEHLHGVIGSPLERLLIPGRGAGRLALVRRKN
jgi:hypothetical protein